MQLLSRVAAVAALATTATLFATPAFATASTTSFVTIVGDGDYLGGNTSMLYRTGNATINVSGTASSVHVSLSGGTSSTWFYLDLTAPTGQVLAPGTYEGAQRSATAGNPGLDVYGDGRGCNTVSGRFVVRDVGVGDDGVVNRFSATYEDHCEGGPKATIGEISINEPTDGELAVANDVLDFPAAYPGVTGRVVPVWLVNTGSVSRSVTSTAVTGTNAADFAVTSNGCGSVAAGAACVVYVRFTAGAAGPRSATLTLTDTSTAGSHVVPLSGSGIPGHTSFTMRSETGDWIGGGAEHAYGPGTSTMSASATTGSFSMGVTTANEWWYTTLTAPGGDVLQAGRTYATASGAAMNISGTGRACSGYTGSFTVLEAAYRDGTGPLERFAATVDQHCDGATAALHVWIAWRATDANVPAQASVLAVTGLVAYPDSTSVVLAWDNPSSTDFSAAVVRGVTGLAAPATPAAGTALYDGTAESVSIGYLSPGESYSFSVWARNRDGVYGAKQSVTVRGTDVSVTVSPSTIAYGGTTTITVRLYDAATGQGLGLKDVDLFVRKKGTHTYEWLDTVHTSTAGVATITIKPPVSADVQATFYATHGYLGSTAGPVTVTVKHWVGASLNHTSIPRNGYATLTASVGPNHAGKTVYLQRYYSGAWHNVASHALGSTSAYGFVLHPTTPGSYQYRVYMPADADHAAGYSASRTLSVT